MAHPTPVPTRDVSKDREVRSIGPSDSSDSGSDLIGPGMTGDDEAIGLDRRADEDREVRRSRPGGDVSESPGERDDGTSDRSGTGEGLAADGDPSEPVPTDIAPDRVVGAEEVGLGGGLDQAEEAQLGVTDEELARRRRN